MKRTRNEVFSIAGRISLALLLLFAIAPAARAGADPAFAFYGYQQIIPNPNPAILGENTHIAVTVSNPGTDPATNVAVRLSFNDWGVTFNGWQPIGTQTVPSIAPGGTAVVHFDYVFQNRAHTCLEALITGADQNDDPNNDRGQINMEVINSGETFGYNVPVVNNGDADLNLHLFGAAKRGQDGTAGNAQAKPIDQDLVVPAGETVHVPVQIDFPPGTPAGAVVDYFLTAIDLARPNDAAGTNHVVLRVIFKSPRALKQEALARLNALPPANPSKSLLAQVEDARKHIRASLDPKLWADDFRLRPQAAGKIFTQEKDAVKKLLDLVAVKGVPLGWKQEFEAAARALTDAERILAQTAIADAGGDPEAKQDLKAADALREAGKYVEAVKRYGLILIDLD